MFCPYVRKKEKHVQCFTQQPDESGIIVKGVTVDAWDFEQAECHKEECGAYYDGKCHFSTKDNV